MDQELAENYLREARRLRELAEDTVYQSARAGYLDIADRYEEMAREEMGVAAQAAAGALEKKALKLLLTVPP